MKTSKSVILSRQDEILSYIQRNNYIKISELAKAFGVSTATIRRDISTLEESGEDIRCKGGICIADTGNALPKFDNERYFSSHTQEKEAIARKTAEFIEDGDTIFINGSSTAFRIIPHIKGKSVTIITNNGRSLFADRNYGTDLIIIGGEVIGNRVRVKVVKNKVAPPFKEAEFDIMYGQGVSRLGEILDLGSKLDIVQKSGAWFNYGDVRLGQGRDNAKEYLRQNPELAEEIAAKVMENADKLMGRTAAAAPKKLGQVNLTAEVDDE